MKSGDQIEPSPASLAAWDAEQRMFVVPEATHPGCRRCVAGRAYDRGDLIFRNPVIVFPMKELLPNIGTTALLGDYVFSWTEPEELAVVCGPCSFINHSYDPNARYIKRFDKLVLDVVALRHIDKGEEIRFNYNGNTDDFSPLWFHCDQASGLERKQQIEAQMHHKKRTMED